MSVSRLDEVRGAEFGDQRLTNRLGKIVEELGAQPTMSVPAATQGRAEMEAAYRFFDNPKVSPEKILQPHLDATRERIRQADVVLLVQDTTELDLTRPRQQVQGAGPLECDSRRGAFFHPLVAFNAGGLPLGVAWQKSWARDKILTELTAKEKEQRRHKTPIEEKESIRWIEGIRAAREVAEACPQTTCVCVADSEADIYELFSEPLVTPRGQVHLLVRACQNRTLSDHDEHSPGSNSCHFVFVSMQRERKCSRREDRGRDTQTARDT